MKVLVATVSFAVISVTCAFSPLKDVKTRFGTTAAMPRIQATPATETEKPAVDKDLLDIFAQNKEWVASKKEADANFFDKLGAVHKPDYLWIGCADARVPANEIMGKEAGTVFVVRNVANLVVNTDANLHSALQYAVGVLKVSHIIVCGHYDCGGVRASMTNKDHTPPLENWLRNIRDVYRLHRKELDAINDPEERHRRLVELNVVEQCINLFKTGAVQRTRIDTFKSGAEYTTPRVHAVVFDPKDGILKPLEVDFQEYISELSPIYDLYTPENSEIDAAIIEEKPQVPKPSRIKALFNRS